MRTISADPDEIDVFQRDIEEDDYIPTFQQEDDESSDDYNESANVSGKQFIYFNRFYRIWSSKVNTLTDVSIWPKTIIQPKYIFNLKQ